MRYILLALAALGIWLYAMDDDHNTKEVEKIIEQSRYEAEIKPYMDWGKKYVPSHVMGNLK